MEGKVRKDGWGRKRKACPVGRRWGEGVALRDSSVLMKQ